MGQHLGGQERRVLRSVYGHGGDGDAGWHLHGREQGVQPVQGGALHGDADDGRVLAAARAPARCAALPAAAMTAPKPASRAVSAKFRAASGVPVRRHDADLRLYAQRLQLAHGLLDHGPVAVAAHHDGYLLTYHALASKSDK